MLGYEELDSCVTQPDVEAAEEALQLLCIDRLTPILIKKVKGLAHFRQLLPRNLLHELFRLLQTKRLVTDACQLLANFLQTSHIL